MARMVSSRAPCPYSTLKIVATETFANAASAAWSSPNNIREAAMARPVATSSEIAMEICKIRPLRLPFTPLSSDCGLFIAEAYRSVERGNFALLLARDILGGL